MRIGETKHQDPHLARRTEDPRVRQIQAAIDEMTMGIFGVRVPKGNDAVGLVGQSLERLAHKLTGRLERILRLMRLSEGINAATTLEDALDYVYFSFRSIIPFDFVCCLLVDEDQKTARSVWARAAATGEALRPGYAASVEGTGLASALRARAPHAIDDLLAQGTEGFDAESNRLLLGEGMRSCLTCPVYTGRNAMGFLVFASKTVGAYRSEHVDYYQRISRLIGLALERAQLYEDITRARTELRDANSKLQALVDYDPLTQLLNRRAFDERLEIEWRRAQRQGIPLTVLMGDVDDFKAFNDHYGHLAGDECLKRVARALSGSLRRAGEFAARFGGEEFVLVLPNVNTRQAAVVAERCLQAVRNLAISHEYSRAAPFVTLSIGAATWNGVSDGTLTGLLQQADAALYRAKECGRNRCSIPSMASVADLGPVTTVRRPQ